MRCIVGILFFSIVLNSCSLSRLEVKFTDAELEWLVYDEGDVITFTNENGQTKSFEVVSRSDQSNIKNIYPIEAEVIIGDTSLGEDFSIYLLKDEKSFKRYLRIGEVYRSLDLMEPIHKMEVDGKMLTDVYVIEENRKDLEGNVWQLLFTKEMGIVRYKTTENKIYDLSFAVL